MFSYLCQSHFHVCTLFSKTVFWKQIPLHLKTSSGAHLAPYPVGTGGSFPRVKGGGMKLTTNFHLAPRSRMHGSIPPLLQYTFIVWYSVKAQGQLYLLSLPLMWRTYCYQNLRYLVKVQFCFDIFNDFTVTYDQC
jgi:hypothetical protein